MSSGREFTWLTWKTGKRPCRPHADPGSPTLPALPSTGPRPDSGHKWPHRLAWTAPLVCWLSQPITRWSVRKIVFELFGALLAYGRICSQFFAVVVVEELFCGHARRHFCIQIVWESVPANCNVPAKCAHLSAREVEAAILRTDHRVVNCGGVRKPMTAHGGVLQARAFPIEHAERRMDAPTGP